MRAQLKLPSSGVSPAGGGIEHSLENYYNKDRNIKDFLDVF